MKWFQHSTDSHDDPDISDAEDIFGDAGYSVFFKILEIYGREFNSIKPDGFLTISKTFVRRKLRKSWTKVEQILNFYQTKNRILFKNSQNDVSICIPKYLKLSDNWTRRQAKDKKPKLRSNSVVAPFSPGTEKEKEIEKNNTSAEVNTKRGFFLNKKKSKNREPQCRNCEMQASNIKKGQTCPYCGRMA